MLASQSQTHRNVKNVMSEKNSAKSKSESLHAVDDLGSQFVKLSSLSKFKNQQSGKISSESQPKPNSNIQNLKMFWENPGKADLKTTIEPICDRPMGGEMFRQISGTNQPQKGQIRRKSCDVTATKLTK